MKKLGYLLLTGGFLAGSLIAVRTPENEVPWVAFVPAVLVAIAGVVLAQLAIRRETHHEGAVTTNVQTLVESIDRLVERIDRLDAERDTLPTYDVHGMIDELLREDLNAFAEARESLAHAYGLQVYADVMNEFAAGERYVNRVWSASVDGWVDEVRMYIGRAAEQLRLTQTKVRAVVETRG